MGKAAQDVGSMGPKFFRIALIHFTNLECIT